MNIRENTQSAKADLNKASEYITDVAQEAKKQAQEYSDELIEYIKDSPGKSVLVASLLGLLVGKFLL